MPAQPDPIDDLLACLGSAQGPSTPAPPPAVGSLCPSVSRLPRGCLARDRHGDAIIVHPNGTYGRPGGVLIPPEIDSANFGPFRIVLMQLDDAECRSLHAAFEVVS